MIIYRRSATSPADLEVVQLVPVQELPPNLRIEVPNMWHVVFSSQESTLTVAPLAEVSASELSSRLNSVEKRIP